MVTHSIEDAARVGSRLIVMREGQIFLTGAPAQVFGQAEALEPAGLTVPQVTKILLALRARGIPVDTTCYTVELALQKLLACRQEVLGC